MLQELLLLLTQFGGGPGDPANNVVRFLLAAFFWGVLVLVSYRMWRMTADRRHLFFSIAAVVGASRELFMFTAEYGSFRGYISYAVIFRYYPPLEHAVAILSIVMMGYAFLRFSFNFDKLSRFFLLGSSILTLLTYVIIAPLWIRFLDASGRASMFDDHFIGARFHDFPGDLVFRLVGAVVSMVILAAFLQARGRGIKVPGLAFLAFFMFFLDDALQAVNDLCNDRYAPLLAPLRHCLHIGAIVQLVGVYWWEATRQINNREQLLQTLLDAIPDQIYYKNTDGIYLGCNQAFAEYFAGKPKDLIAGQRVHDLLADQELAERFVRGDHEVLVTGRSFTDELPYTQADGKRVVLETVMTQYRDDESNVAGLIGVSRDITERKALEDQLRNSHKMEAVGQLAGGVAHDFNNILTVISSYASLMQFELGAAHPQAGFIASILTASTRATKLVKNLMTFSRRKYPAASSYDLNSIIDDFRDFLQRIITEDIQLNISCDEAVLNVYVDSGQIEQVLTNLVANARDAMPKGGSLTIKTERAELDNSFDRLQVHGLPGSYALLTVTDNGHGMDEETRKHIFEPYFTTREIGKGTGLGLASVYSIIKHHNGFITVYSELGNGTVFQVYLPIVAMESATMEKDAEEYLPGTGKETILVADDETDVCSVIETILQKFGYRVISAKDGQDAVAKFAANHGRISLVLMDIIMPRLNGKDAANEIRRIKPGMKILFTSGYAADIIKSRGELAAGEDMLLKPVNPQDFLRKVREMLDR